MEVRNHESSCVTTISLRDIGFIIIIPVIYLTNPIPGLAMSSVTSSVLSYHTRKRNYYTCASNVGRAKPYTHA